jgi:DNA-directed RNA polymerase subunit M/transcription elongation factor TFIIS
MSTGFYGVCPSCGSRELSSISKPTYHHNPDGTKGMWQLVKCERCIKRWRVSWDEEKLPDYGGKMFIIKCTECGYQTKIRNPADFLNYRALHQDKYGHTGMMLSEEVSATILDSKTFCRSLGLAHDVAHTCFPCKIVTG